MLTAVCTSFFTRPKHPSALLLVSDGSMTHILHPVPEVPDLIEQWGSSCSNRPPDAPFRRNGAREQWREQIGTVTLPVHTSETMDFVADVYDRMRKLRADNEQAQSTDMRGADLDLDVARLVDEVLRPAALGAIRDREGHAGSKEATETYPVYVVYVKRRKPEPISAWGPLFSVDF
ncbi:hypothetical protein EVJ58_g10297 [Rhodofomes roseus]|uniref:Uncharacterized protein n=1 Tax=Rhodofomes roseus TaxID=34475 RepID=A0A4Y9XNN1_9APHY|nr:hypothetical protein EVJ58_g10297 [Rhodofomes roseus]